MAGLVAPGWFWASCTGSRLSVVDAGSFPVWELPWSSVPEVGVGFTPSDAPESVPAVGGGGGGVAEVATCVVLVPAASPMASASPAASAAAPKLGSSCWACWKAASASA